MTFLRVRNLSYTYPDGTVALRDVAFEVEDGQSVGIVGPNGAGKSTLLWHLNGLLPAAVRSPIRRVESNDGAAAGASGSHNDAEVIVDGLAVVEANFPAIRRMVGLLFQDPDDQLFCATVREDVAFGPVNLDLPRDEVDRRVAQALADVDLEGAEHRMPQHLSLGERKRVCLAGVLACRPKLLALDEPSGNLDPRGRRHLMGILSQLTCTKLIASHDLELILELCDRVIVLDSGRIQALGPTEEILGNEILMLAHGLELPLSLRLGGRITPLSSGERAG